MSMIYYALIAVYRDGEYVLVAEANLTKGSNLAQICKSILNEVDAKDQIHSLRKDEVIFHYKVNEGVCYMCASSSDLKVRRSHGLLQLLMNAYEKENRPQNRGFVKKLIKEQLSYANDPSSDKIGAAMKKVANLKEEMIEGIEMVLQRGEKLDVLIEKTDEISTQAKTYQKKSKTLKQKMLIRLCILLAMVVCVILAIIVVVIVLSCGVTFQWCVDIMKKKESSD